jgi:adenine-specific DNA methylase
MNMDIDRELSFMESLSSNAAQLSLPVEVEAEPGKTFRPIHYLGSKLRILDFIKDAIDKVDPSNGCVCDLFAGSGTVSRFLSNERPVISVDIQEYSRVLCSALLRPYCSIKYCDVVELCRKSEHFEKLRWALEPLINHETNCINLALSEHPIPLCELIENGSIISFESGFAPEVTSNLIKAIKLVSSRLSKYKFKQGPSALVTRYFGGVYFSYLQAIQIDSLLEVISKEHPEVKDSLLAAALSTVSEIVNTVGKQFAQPLKPRKNDGTPKKGLGARVKKDRSMDVFIAFEKWLETYSSQTASGFYHKVYKMDYSKALDLMKHEVKAVYADPPYTRDHYSRFYHVLETICLRDNPVVSMSCVKGKLGMSRGIYRENRHQSPFCIKSQASLAFENLFRKVRNLEVPLVLSYSPFDKDKPSRPRLATIDNLKGIATKFYKHINVISPGVFTHSKLNCSEKNFEVPRNGELLVLCEIK